MRIGQELPRVLCLLKECLGSYRRQQIWRYRTLEKGLEWVDGFIYMQKKRDRDKERERFLRRWGFDAILGQEAALNVMEECAKLGTGKASRRRRVRRVFSL